MRYACCLITCFALAYFFAGCSKDGGTPHKDVFVVSPQKIVAMNGEDWDAVEPEMKDKAGYSYLEFSLAQDTGFKAVVALTAKDESNDSVYYDLTLAIGRSTNKVVSINMETNDSLRVTDKNLSYNLLQQYYNEGVEPVIDTNAAAGSYEMDNGGYQTTTVDDLTMKLNSGVAYPEVDILYNSDNMNFIVSAFQSSSSNHYIFSFTESSH